MGQEMCVGGNFLISVIRSDTGQVDSSYNMLTFFFWMIEYD